MQKGLGGGEKGEASLPGWKRRKGGDIPGGARKTSEWLVVALAVEAQW